MALCDEPTYLGLPEWTDCCSKQLEPSMEECLWFPQVVSEEELAELSKGYTLKSTEANTKWALNNFFEWMKARNKRLFSQSVPCDILSSCDSAILSEWLYHGLLSRPRTRKENFICPPPSISCLLLYCAICEQQTATVPISLYMYRRYFQYIYYPQVCAYCIIRPLFRVIAYGCSVA